MKPKKILKIFKKGKAAVSKRGSDSRAGEMVWPPGIRIGLYGHANSGKTVFFSVLHEECKVSKKLQISAADNATYEEFISNLRKIHGLESSVGEGTIVDFRGDQSFPEPTDGDKLLLFNTVIDQDQKVSVVTLDYPGGLVSISQEGEARDKVLTFMDEAQGLIFFYDPKLLNSELESQTHVASVITMLERLSPLRSRLPVPIALVVTKADLLPGFSGENETILIPPESENLFSEDYETFLESVLSSHRIASNPVWAGSVRHVLVRLKEFLNLVLERTLDFQIFFVSSTGQTPEKVGSAVGRSIYKPPHILRPVGIQEPFYWILKSIMRSRSLSRFKRLVKWVAMASMIWITLYSTPRLFHFFYLLPSTTETEAVILEGHSNSYLNIKEDERKMIIRQYERYADSRTVNWFFPRFAPVARRISESYRNFDIQDAINRLETSIHRFATIVADPEEWPTPNPKDGTIVLNENHRKLIRELQKYHAGDSTSVLYRRSDRVLGYWDLFEKAIMNPADTVAWNLIPRQITTNRRLFAKELSSAENDLMDVLLAKRSIEVKEVVAHQIGEEFGDRIKRINSNLNPSYRLGDAVLELTDIRNLLQPGAERNMVDRYIQDAKRWFNKQDFRYRVEVIPDNGFLYIEVTEDGGKSSWSEFLPIYQDEEYKISWKIGDDIHISFCEANKNCNRGKSPSDKIVLTDDYCIFEMDKDLHFKNIDKHVTLRFKPPLSEQLPKLE